MRKGLTSVRQRLKIFLTPPGLAVLSGVLLVVPFLAENLGVFAWFGFLPLLYGLRGQSLIRAFRNSYLCGIIFWLLAICWLAHVTVLGLLVLVLYLALYYGIFGCLVASFMRRERGLNLVYLPALWVILEYIRGRLFTGFPWALLGYSQYKNLHFIQIADITGAWGVSFLVMLINVTIYKFVASRLGLALRVKRYSIVMLAIVINFLYGCYRMHTSPAPSQRIKVSVVQGNIPQELKWDRNAVNFIINRYTQLTLQAAKDRPDLIIWPEAASPVVIGEREAPEAEIFRLGQKIKIPILIGAVVSDAKGYYNSALLINDSGQVAMRYNKLHLVPFGEYIPLKGLFPFMETVVPIGDINRGDTYVVFKQPVRFSVLICFEDLFPELSRRFVREGAVLLVNITNDAWYKKTPAAYQHFQASVFRAVENRVFLARAANTGISGFIAPSGRVISLVQDRAGQKIFVEGFKTEGISIGRGRPGFYNRYGDIFILACALIVFSGIVAAFRIRR